MENTDKDFHNQNDLKQGTINLLKKEIDIITERKEANKAQMLLYADHANMPDSAIKNEPFNKESEDKIKKNAINVAQYIINQINNKFKYEWFTDKDKDETQILCNIYQRFFLEPIDHIYDTRLDKENK